MFNPLQSGAELSGLAISSPPHPPFSASASVYIAANGITALYKFCIIIIMLIFSKEPEERGC